MARKINPKNHNPEQQGTEKVTRTISTIVDEKIKESLKDFSKFSEKEKNEISSSTDFFEQFREYFKDQHPMLLGEIENKENLTIYIQNLEKSGFSLESLIKKNKELHQEFKETNDEKSTIESSLKDLKKYCESTENKMPKDIFEDFAKDIGLETKPSISIINTTKINKIGNLTGLRKKFLENKGIKLKDYQSSELEKITSPAYLPTERLLISASIKKIKRNLPDKLAKDFDSSFQLPIDVHSSIQNLRDFKQQWTLFLDRNQTNIDKDLAKKLDNIIVSNGDMYKELQYEGENIEWTKGFSEQTKNFRQMFNKLATRQLFDKAKEKGTYIEHYMEQLSKDFKEFPPYLNELFNVYPYRYKDVIENNPEIKAKYSAQQEILLQKEILLSSPKPEDQKDKSLDQRREDCSQEVKKAQKALTQIKREAYSQYIKQKNPEIGNIINSLYKSNFDMSKLSKSDQQKIINILVEEKLGNSIKNQIPNILSIDSNEYQTFIKNIFDLNQKSITIPTQYGNIPINFLDKSIFGGPVKENMEIDDYGKLISDQKNLPINFKIQVTEQNKNFFEENVVFGDLFSEFNNKNGIKKLNDSYKVRIKNPNGTYAEGYLSEYPPSEEIEQEIETNHIKPGRFLYSHPITRPEDARNIMTWNNDNKTPVVISKDSESQYEVDIISKELNLNGEAIGGLLFSHILGKYNLEKELDIKQEKRIASKFGKIENIYKDTNEMIGIEEKQEKKPERKDPTVEELKEQEYQEFIKERDSLKGYNDKPEGSTENGHDFKNGSKLLIRLTESGFLPSGSYFYANAEIKNIDKDKGTFQITYKGCEKTLGKYEGITETLKLTKSSLQKVKERFEDNIYKLPGKAISKDINKLISTLEGLSIDSTQPSQSFKQTHRDGNNFIIDTGKEKGEKATYFGVIETLPGEDAGKESQVGYMYKINHNSLKNTFKLTANDENKTTIELDYPNFILFVSSRKLQPKTEKSAKLINIPDSEGPTIGQPKKWKGYSIASIIGLFKNFSKKISDGLKKYEEEQIEDLTEDVFHQGKLFTKLAGFMPTKKMKEAFENAGKEYMQERDNKTWKKIEKYLKFYESDPDFGGDYMRGTKIKPFLNGEKPFKDHQQAAAMLLATIKKGKGPYSRNTDRAGKGKWIKILFGEGHQKRYLLMKEKLQRELEQGYNIHGQIWADDLQNRILKLEMEYITHCIDGRRLSDRDDVPRLESTFSKKFAGELETESNKFFSESVSSSTKEKGYSFELARFEYFRLLADRPQQAIPCLKQIAAKAVTPIQRQVFQSAVLVGMLSGVFYNITQADKSFIQKICRTIGFLPGMWIRDPNHHQKIEQFINIATGEKIDSYNVNEFGFGKGKDLNQYKKAAGYDGGINKWLWDKGRLDKIAKFAAMSGQNYQGKTLIELLNSPDTPKETKQLLSEIEGRSLEQLEGVDPDIKMNGYGLSQNILAKNQSLIDEITDFHEGKFKGKDKDEIQGIQTAWKTIAAQIPKSKVEDENQIIYIIKKFINWFDSRGFNVEEKRFLIRTLLTAQNEIRMGNTESADEILRYTIVGNIVKNSGNGQAPEELISGLEAFKSFFKSNMETILKPDIIEKGLGSIFVSELDKGPYKVAPREEYADLAENQYFFGSKEENKKRSENRKKYNIDQIYINKRLYRYAQQIEQKNHIGNKFKNHMEQKTNKTTSENIHEVLSKKDIRIKNKEVIDKVKRKLSGDSDQNMTEEELAAAMQGGNDYYGY